MDPIVLTKAIVAASANNIALTQTPVSGTPLTLSGTTAGVLDTQRRVLLTFGSEAANRTLVLTGTNDAGAVITETLAIPSGAGATVASVQDFKTVTQAMPLGSGWTAAVTLGTNGVGSSPWFVPNFHITPFSMEFQATLTGTANFSIELTETSPLVPIYPLGVANAQPIPTVFSPTGFTALSATAAATLTFPVQGWRLTINSGSGSVALAATQAGIRN
jgi:hypothetical protein